MAIRAKIRCSRRTVYCVYGYDVLGKVGYGEVMWKIDPTENEHARQTCHREFEFNATYKDDPTHENKAFWEATPQFEMRMTIQNPDADFEVGREYYLDFVKAPR